MISAGQKPTADYERIYRNSVPNANLPSMDYLQKKRSSVFHKAFETGQQAMSFVPPVHEKDPAETVRLQKLFASLFLTKGIDDAQRKILADAMFPRRFTAGEKIIRYGDIGSEYFVLAKGSVRVTVYKPGTAAFDAKINEKIALEKDLNANPDLDPTQGMIGFGEIALLYNDKRTASIVALTDCDTWVLTAECFKYIIAQQSIRRRNISLDFLNQVELFNELEQYEKVKLIDGLETLTRQKGEFIFHEGDRGDHFYIIEEGQVEFGHENEEG